MKRGNPWVKYFGLALVLYMVFSVGKLAYKNYQLNVTELKLKEEISILENEISDLENKIVYYQSDSYKEKMIRAKLNMQKEGEKVVVITPEPDIEEVEPQKDNKKLTNPERWWAYFIGI
jgi:cell division protein FtsB